MTAAWPRQVEGAALGWLSRNRDRFALGEDALSSDGPVNSTWKPLGELAQVCASLGTRIPRSDPLRALARDLLAFAWRETERGDLFVRLQRAEPFATYPLEVYAAFASAGLRHRGFEEAAATLSRTRGRRLTEQDPTRRLGVLMAGRHCGLQRHERLDEAVRRTWLGGLPEPWTFERSAGYALTHVVFHLTDWGRGGPGLPPDLTDYLAQWLPAWLTTCLEAGMWDLGCELLAVAASLPGPPEEAVLHEGWAAVADAQLDSGALPEEAGPTEPGDACDFVRAYHSTLMAAFAGGLTTARTGPSRAVRTTDRRETECAARRAHSGQGGSR
ncbi:hypothetical protein ABZT17_37105 [Streptomyces sp. NPDC005648]|uniref:DUF6895 family protein n=1 Tax=Streptomyces sp. NPDC005648 TaxID=3157044 RepID=UPI0033BD8FC8